MDAGELDTTCTGTVSNFNGVVATETRRPQNVCRGKKSKWSEHWEQLIAGRLSSFGDITVIGIISKAVPFSEGHIDPQT